MPMKTGELLVPEKRGVRRSFDRAADTYDGAAVLHREICGRIFERLDYIKLAPRHVLDLGCGTGYASAKLLARYPDAQIIGVDIAPAMLRRARALNAAPGLMQRLMGKSRRYCGLCADAEALPLMPCSTELVFSNLTLQWCDPSRFLNEAQRVLAPGGLLMFSTFGPDTLKELRAEFGALDEYPHVNAFLDMHDIGDLLVNAGFGDPVMDMEIVTLTYADLKSLMIELKSIGAHNVLPGRRAGLMGRSAWQRMVSGYEKHRSDGRLPATFEVVYGHAWKPLQAPRKREEGRQVIEFRTYPKADP
jgi:malonyl-CoA O-methyltransferase